MTEKKIGYFSLVLHSHIPYVLGHGSWPHGTDWLSEVTCESYIPLLNLLNKLSTEGINIQVTLGITPVLAEQLSHPGFKRELTYYLDHKIESAQENISYFKKQNQSHLEKLASFWKNYYSNIKKDFQEKYRENLVAAYKKLQDEDKIEILTSAATHAYLPLLSQDSSIQAQIKQGVETYRKHFGKIPKGIWLPECAYRPAYEWKSPLQTANKSYPRKGLDEFLSENYLEYFIIDSALLRGGKSIGVYLQRFEPLKKLWSQFEKEYTPRPEEKEKSHLEIYLVNSSGQEKKPVAIFARDPQTGLQVWSGEYGYPGDGNYLDFHKKHFPGGLRYWKVTSSKSDLKDKQEYVLEYAATRIPENAAHFKHLIKTSLENYFNSGGKTGFICAPYDCELFGHWWFEGIEFLGQVLRLIQEDGKIGAQTCGKYLQQNYPSQVISLPEGSWGEGNYHYIWLNKDTEWTWKKIYHAEERILHLIENLNWREDRKLEEILKQLSREFFLLIASDWQFLISTWSARDYAEKRFWEHSENFQRLSQIAETYAVQKELSSADGNFLEKCQTANDIFQEIDLNWFLTT